VIVLLSEVPVDSESRTQAAEILREMAVESRAEPGVIDYRVTRDLEQPDTFRIVETYEDAAAVEAHESSAHLAEFQRAIGPHLDGEPELYRYDVETRIEMDGP
jgi:quinol monooxygenase YgiN